MPIPLRQNVRVGRYLLQQKRAGREAQRTGGHETGS